MKAFANYARLSQNNEEVPRGAHVKTSKSEKFGFAAKARGQTTRELQTRDALSSPPATLHELFELFRRIQKPVRAMKASQQSGQ